MTPDSPATGPGNEALADLVKRLDRAHRMACSDPSDPARKTLYSEARDALTAAAAVSEARDAAVGEMVRRIRGIDVGAHIGAYRKAQTAIADLDREHIDVLEVGAILSRLRRDVNDDWYSALRAALQPDHADEDSERAKFASECCQDCGMHPGIGCQWWCKNNKPDHADAGDEAPAPQDEPAEGEVGPPPADWTCVNCGTVQSECNYFANDDYCCSMCSHLPPAPPSPEGDDSEAARFQYLAENNLRLGAAIDLALEASYWDRPYDTRLEAIREVLHEALGDCPTPDDHDARAQREDGDR